MMSPDSRSSSSSSSMMKEAVAATDQSAPPLLLNENSLFAELSLQDLGDVDKGADIAGRYSCVTS